MKLSDLVTDKTRYDVHKRDLIDLVSVDIPMFKDYDGKLPLKKLIQYIILMYDPESPMRRQVGHYVQRKAKTAEAVGFAKEKNKWSKDVERLLVGGDKYANKMIASYLSYLAMPEYTELAVLLEIQRIKAFEAFSGDVTDNTHKTMSAVTENIQRITKQLFGSGEFDEVASMRRSLYEQSNMDKVPRPEDVVDMLAEGDLPEDFNPYGEDYKVADPKFLDDEEPG